MFEEVMFGHWQGQKARSYEEIRAAVTALVGHPVWVNVDDTAGGISGALTCRGVLLRPNVHEPDHHFEETYFPLLTQGLSTLQLRRDAYNGGASSTGHVEATFASLRLVIDGDPEWTKGV